MLPGIIILYQAANRREQAVTGRKEGKAMIIYQDTEKELFFEDYKPVSNIRLIDLSIDSLEELKKNLENALENTFLFGSELLGIAIDTDIRKVDLYLKMKYKKQERQNSK